MIETTNFENLRKPTIWPEGLSFKYAHYILRGVHELTFQSEWNSQLKPS